MLSLPSNYNRRSPHRHHIYLVNSRNASLKIVYLVYGLARFSKLSLVVTLKEDVHKLYRRYGTLLFDVSGTQSITGTITSIIKNFNINISKSKDKIFLLLKSYELHIVHETMKKFLRYIVYILRGLINF